MSNAFEFYPNAARRLAFPERTVVVAVASFLLLLLINLYFYNSSGRLQRDIAAATARIEQEATVVLEKASRELPGEAEIARLEKLINAHNAAVGGVRSVWTQLFNAISEVFPENVYIVAIEQPKTSKGIFAARDRDFRLRLAVPGVDVANDLYMRLADNRLFGSLSFTPRGEIKVGNMPALGIEVQFRFDP